MVSLQKMIEKLNSWGWAASHWALLTQFLPWADQNEVEESKEARLDGETCE
jgi:hypothetical protein